MSLQPINHHEALAALMPQQIAANIGIIRQIKAAMAARKSGVALRHDATFLKRLNDIFAPLHEAQIKGNIPTYTADTMTARAQERFVTMRGMAELDFQGLNYLDIGCGAGHNIEEAHRLGAAFSAGIDANPGHKRHWDNRLGDSEAMRFILDDLHTYDFEGRVFNVISSFNSFEHFDDPALVLERCRKIIADHGLLFLFFNPIYRAPMGSHQYRKINIPYVQNLFADEVVAGVFDEDETADPYPGLNRKRVREFEEILIGAQGWRLAAFRKTTDYRFAWMAQVFRAELGAMDDEDLFVNGIITVLQAQPG